MFPFLFYVLKIGTMFAKLENQSLQKYMSVTASTHQCLVYSSHWCIFIICVSAVLLSPFAILYTVLCLAFKNMFWRLLHSCTMNTWFFQQLHRISLCGCSITYFASLQLIDFWAIPIFCLKCQHLDSCTCLFKYVCKYISTELISRNRVVGSKGGFQILIDINQNVFHRLCTTLYSNNVWKCLSSFTLLPICHKT